MNGWLPIVHKQHIKGLQQFMNVDSVRRLIYFNIN